MGFYSPCEALYLATEVMNKQLKKILSWRSRNINDRQFMMMLAVLVGFSVGIAAVIIKNLVHLIQMNLNEIANNIGSYLFFLFPVIGIFITVMFIKYINRRPVRHGIPNVLYAISKNSGIIRAHNLYSSIISSAFTVGFGGSVGLEGPTVATGAAIGSNIGKTLQLNYKQITLLLGCASAGAMSAIFKAPIAAIVFALEVIMLDLTVAAIVPLLISSATAALTSYLFLGQNVLYSFRVTDLFVISNTPYYIILGIIAGLVSLYFTRMYLFVSGTFEKIKSWYNRLLIGGLVLGVLIFFLPSLYGEGYEEINLTLAGDYSHLFENPLYEMFETNLLFTFFIFVLILIFKVVATSATFGSGGVGGIFAPSLFMGAKTGLFFALLMNYLGLELPETNFALVGMAGLIAGVIHAPLTAIFLIAEITGGYQLFMPLMIVSTISFATTRFFTTNSVYTYQLSKRGELMTHHKDKALLMLMNINSLIESDFHTVHPNDKMRDLIKVITKTHRNIFPVTESDGTFRGIVKMDDIRHIMFNQEMYDQLYVRDLMFMPQYVIERHESMEEVARKFQVSGRYNIAVLEKGKYLGFVSRAKLFSSYRKLLRDFSED
jgi:CIC family chloride channel protein